MSLFLLDADYVKTEKQALIRLWLKDESGKLLVAKVKDYSPYFFILLDQTRVKDAERKVRSKLSKEPYVKDMQLVEMKKLGERMKFLKVTCNLPSQLQKARDLIKVLESARGGSGEVIDEYEYAMNFYRKFLIDSRINGCCWIEIKGLESLKEKKEVEVSINDLKVLQTTKKEPKLKIVAFDIECVEENGENRVVMISLYSEGLRKVITTLKQRDKKLPSFVEVVGSEKALILRFVELINELDPDIIASFNGDGFDFAVLDERAKANKIELTLGRDGSKVVFTRRARESSARIAGRVHLDVFQFVNNILSPHLQTEVLTLDAVSAELLGDRKIELDYQELLETVRKKRDPSKLAEYCLKDSELTYKLVKLLLPQMLSISQTVGQILFDVSRMTYGQLVEWYLLRKARERDEVLPNQPKFEEIRKRRMRTYVGGFVKEPIAGLHEQIAVVDFKSLYPTIIASFNISPETLDCDCCKGKAKVVPETKHWICEKRRGFVSEVIKELVERRSEIKKRMKKLDKKSLEYRLLDAQQYALKIIANACYGMFGFAGARYYCHACAEVTAALGRHWIRKIIKLAEENSFLVIYGDTDSCFLKSKEKLSDEDFKKKVLSFLELVNKQLPGIMRLDLQGFYKRGIFIPRGVGYGTAKKRYALISYEGELLVRGLETVRRDWCNLAKEVQRNVLLYVLRDNDVNKAINYVRDVVEKLRKLKVNLKDLIIYEQLTKPISEYKQISPHVVAAKRLLEQGYPVGEGSIIMFVITKGSGSISQRAMPAEFVELKDVDVDYYISHQVIPAAMRVLAALGVSESRLEQRGLERFLTS